VAVRGSRAAAAEEVAVVIRSAIAAHLEGVEVMMPEVAMPEPPPVPAPAPAPAPKPPSAEPDEAEVRPSRDTLRLDIAYRGTLYGSGTPWQSGVALSLEVKPIDHWSFGLGIAILTPLRVERMGVTTEVRRHPVEGSVGFELDGTAVVGSAEARLGVDFIERRTTGTSAGLDAAPMERRTIVSTALGLAGALRLSGGVRLQVGIFAEILLNRYDHVIRGPSGESTTIKQLPARPRVEAGLSFPLL
jgi:hypothetical protein